jgi:peptide/nickel transport system substrate-binding protein
MAANILSGAVDVLLPIGVSVESAVEIEERWKGTGNTVIYNPGDRTEILYTQQRPDLAQPRNGFPNVMVRQAMLHAIDRQTLADVASFGKSPIAESWLNAADPMLAQIRDSIPRYPHDPVRAQQLLTQAGWVRGADGILVHQPSGERFEVELHSSAGSDSEQILSIIADGWKAVGAQTRIFIVPAQLAQDTAARARLSGAGSISFAAEAILSDMLRTGGRRNIYQGYSNPRYDAAVDKLFTTLARAERVPVHRELVQVGMGDVAVMPLHYRVDPYLAVKGVKGVRGHPNTEAAWNIFEWDKD